MITLFPTKYGAGFINPLLTPEPMEGVQASVAEGFAERYESDAHFTAYYEPDGSARRVNLSSLSAEGGARPLLSALVADVDFPAHAQGWEDPDLTVQAYEWVEAALGRFPELGVYSTLGGLRLVGLLAKPIEARYASHLLELFHGELLKAGVGGLDTTCKDWTRLYRLPYVRREGVGDVEPPHELYHLPTEPLSWDYGILTERVKHVSDVVESYGPRPAGVPIPEGEPVANGERHAWQLKTAGRYARLHRCADPHELYDVVAPRMAASVYPGEDVDQVLAHAWQSVCAVASSHATEAVRDQHAVDVVGSMLAVEKKKADQAFGRSWEELSRRFILCLPGCRSYVAYDPTLDSYTPFAVTEKHLPGLIAKMADKAPFPAKARELIPTTYETDRGATRKIPAIELFERYGRFVRSVTYEYGYEGGAYEGEDDGGELVLGCCPVLEADPFFDEEIDGWIRAFAGDLYQNVVRWLATVRFLDRPTCAIYMYGGPGTGKTLFTTLVASLFNSAPTEWERIASSKFNDQLLRGPIIAADEPRRGLGRGSTKFRQIISGARLDIEAKGMPVASLKGSPRIIITANNDQAMAFEDSLGKRDIEALTERTGVVPVQDRSRAYLEERLEDVRNSWRGKRFAAYVSWLEQNVEVDTTSSRWLVAGWDAPLLRNISAHTSVAYEILAIIAGRIAAQGGVHGESDGVFMVGDEVYISPPHLKKLWTGDGRSSTNVTKRELTAAIRTNSLDDHTTAVKASKGRGRARRLWRLDLDKLASVAIQEGTFESADDLRSAVADKTAPKHTTPTTPANADQKRMEP